MQPYYLDNSFFWLSPVAWWVEPSVEPSAAEDFLVVKLREALESLPTLQRDFIWAFYFDGQSYNQIARKLKITSKAAEKLHRRAKRRLRERLSSYLANQTYSL